mgnify:CR=1 FL=1
MQVDVVNAGADGRRDILVLLGIVHTGDVVGKDGVVDIADIIYICTVVDGEGVGIHQRIGDGGRQTAPDGCAAAEGKKGDGSVLAALQIIFQLDLDAVGELSTFLDQV